MGNSISLCFTFATLWLPSLFLPLSHFGFVWSNNDENCCTFFCKIQHHIKFLSENFQCYDFVSLDENFPFSNQLPHFVLCQLKQIDWKSFIFHHFFKIQNLWCECKNPSHMLSFHMGYDFHCHTRIEMIQTMHSSFPTCVTLTSGNFK